MVFITHVVRSLLPNGTSRTRSFAQLYRAEGDGCCCLALFILRRVAKGKLQQRFARKRTKTFFREALNKSRVSQSHSSVTIQVTSRNLNSQEWNLEMPKNIGN